MEGTSNNKSPLLPPISELFKVVDSRPEAIETLARAQFKQGEMLPPPPLDNNKQFQVTVFLRNGTTEGYIQDGRKTTHRVKAYFECDRCGITKTPEKRLGPNGPATLCNRCGLRWRREEKLNK